MKVLISGAGIAGLTLAYWLRQNGHTPIVIEKASNIRTDGYIIDFLGSGWDVANRIGIIPALKAVSHPIQHLVYKDSQGKTTSEVSVENLYRALNAVDRYLALDRRDLVETLYHTVKSDVEIRFSSNINSICQSTDNVTVTWNNHFDEGFDLLVGADGIHSHVRQLVFGEEPEFAKYLGYYVSVFYAPALIPDLNEEYVIHLEPGIQFGIYALSKERWMICIIYRHPDQGYIPPEKRLTTLQTYLGQVGWVAQDVLKTLAANTLIFLDTVTQIRMPKWSNNRVVLIGDAAHCSTLISGHGASLAMAGAYFLANELSQTSSCSEALTRYEAQLRPHIERIQKKAERFAPSFVPDSKFGIVLTNWVIRLMNFAPVAKLVGKQFSGESIIPV